ncbi:MAG: DUF4160 domain-containing protein [Streptosporangiaceae bacterium]
MSTPRPQAASGSREARVVIANLKVLASTLTTAELKAVLARMAENQDFLLKEWERLRPTPRRRDGYHHEHEGEHAPDRHH